MAYIAVRWIMYTRTAQYYTVRIFNMHTELTFLCHKHINIVTHRSTQITHLDTNKCRHPEMNCPRSRNHTNMHTLVMCTCTHQAQKSGLRRWSVFKGDCRHAVIGLGLIDKPISNTCSDNMGGISVCSQSLQMGSLRLRVQHIKRRLQSDVERLTSPRLAAVRLIEIN